MNYELGILGAGNMAEAIVRGSLANKVLTAANIIVSDVNPQRRNLFASLGVAVTEDNAQVVSSSHQIMLAVKPQTLPPIAPLLAQVTHRQIVISIMAGVSTAKLETVAGHDLRSVRVMPNTPLMIGQGMTGVALGAHAQSGDEALTLKLFASGGQVVTVAEEKIDAITAVSGSGPAYVYYLAEAMEQAARELGLGDASPMLVKQTILGAAMLMLQSTDATDVLRRKVTSPGGTTEAAIKHMEGNKTTLVIVNALKAAQKRAVELGA